MKLIKLAIGLALSAALSTSAFAGSHGSCKILDISQTDSHSNYVSVKMACNGTGLPAPNTAGCAANMSQDIIVFDATTEIGKVRLSLLLSAQASKRNAHVTSWGTCPTEANYAPLMYGVTLKSE